MPFMAETIGGAFLSALVEVLIKRISSCPVMDFFKTPKLSEQVLEKLNTTMISINGVLDDAEEMQITKPAVKSWLDELKHAVYEADDLLDEIAYEALKSERHANPVRNFLSSLNVFKKGFESKLEEHMMLRLQGILDRLEYLVNQKDLLGLREGIGEKSSLHKLPTTCLVDESGIYGRDGDKEAVLKLLSSDDDEDIGVVPIVGMGGVGKTTLCQLVYNDSRVRDWFDVKVWVCVSEEFDVFQVSKDVLKELSLVNCDAKTPNQLQLDLKERLVGKRFLLVLDDVWNMKHADWDILLRPFSSAARGSRIIVTTQNESVASAMQNVLTVYRLRELTHNDCWFLFAKHAFDNGDPNAFPDLKEIGGEIGRKCKGLPLAAKALGGLLRSKRDAFYWEKILKSNMWDLPDQSVLPALRLSYHYLPSHLKRCFAYCAIFPKDYEFEKEELVLLWMAEGFLVQPGRNKEMEDIGDECFQDLVSRSFFQQSRIHRSSFVMHDLINDLAKFVSGDFCFRVEGEDTCNIGERTRHLSYARTDYGASKKFEGIYAAHLARTFLLVEWSRIDNEVTHNLLSKLKHLRVLSLSQYGRVGELPDSIGSLRHLRYLNLSAASIKSLPENVSTLFNLQTLNLHECRDLVILPDSIGNLKCLRYLNLCGTLIKRLPESTSSLHNLRSLILCGCKVLIELPINLGSLVTLRQLDISETKLQEMPQRMGNLRNLQNLTDFILGNEGGSRLKELGMLHYLSGTLRIWNLKYVLDVADASEANLKNKRHLKGLELRWEGDTDNSMYERSVLEQLQPNRNIECLVIDGYGGTRFPDWVGHSSFSNMVSLKLSGCKYCFSLPTLGLLTSLKELSIIGFDEVITVGTEFFGSWTSTNHPFASLETLRFENMLQWREWIFDIQEEEVAAFSQLRELYIKECPSLTSALPTHLPSLTTLEIEGCQQLVASLPRAPTILGMTLRDNSRDVLLVKLPSGLHRLIINRFDSPDTLAEGMEHMGRLSTSLEEIEIKNCDSLEYFPLELFAKLKTLRISRCRNLKSLFAPDSSHGAFTPLSSLEIRECPNLVSFFREGLAAPNLMRILLLGCSNVESFFGKTQLPCSLASLKIWDFQNLKSLDYMGLHLLTSLRELEIYNCPKLQSLPEKGMPHTLCSLSIFLCPLLEQRCQREGGEDWPKISHIPHVEINFHRIN